MKDKNLAGVLALFIGGVGAHHFYLGNKGKGILYLMFCWTFVPLIIAVIEGLSLLFSDGVAFDKKYNSLAK